MKFCKRTTVGEINSDTLLSGHSPVRADSLNVGFGASTFNFFTNRLNPVGSCSQATNPLSQQPFGITHKMKLFCSYHSQKPSFVARHHLSQFGAELSAYPFPLYCPATQKAVYQQIIISLHRNPSVFGRTIFDKYFRTLHSNDEKHTCFSNCLFSHSFSGYNFPDIFIRESAADMFFFLYCLW